MLVEQLYKYTKDHWHVHLTWVDCMVYVAYPIKLLIKRTGKGWYSRGINCRVDTISGPEGIRRAEQIGEAHLTGYTSRLWPLPVRRAAERHILTSLILVFISCSWLSFSKPNQKLGSKEVSWCDSLKSVFQDTELGASWCAKHKIFCVAGELRPGKEG